MEGRGEAEEEGKKKLQVDSRPRVEPDSEVDTRTLRS